MSAWGQINNPPIETMNFAEIMSEEYATRLQEREKKRMMLVAKERDKGNTEIPSLPSSSNSKPKVTESLVDENGEVWEDYTSLLATSNDAKADEQPSDVTKEDEDAAIGDDLKSDELIARLLQSNFDREYNLELKRIEQQKNKQSNITISLKNFQKTDDLELYESEDSFDDDEDEVMSLKRDWDRFETNEKKLDAIPKCGFKVDKEGEMITKHDEKLCGIRNACRVMSFPPEFATGDGAGFDMKLSNQVFNQLKIYSRRRNGKRNKMQDRKVNIATAEMGLDVRTRLIIYKLINNQLLEQINGIFSTGKEAVLLHANSDLSFLDSDHTDDGQMKMSVSCPKHLMPKECAVKIFKTTLNEFKQRDLYIKDDFRFKDRFNKQNKKFIINLWAEKEKHNLIRMKNVGINCPQVVVLKKHVLVMSFIGDDRNAAPKLKDAHLSTAELSCAYEEIVEVMHKLYNQAKLVHADLSEFNILWYEGHCWFIDVAQSVEPEHPSALEYLMRDCDNIINFFSKRGLSKIYTKEELFKYITSLNADYHNVAMLEKIRTRGASIKQATAPNECQEECPDELKPISFPFDLAWEARQILTESMNTDAVPQETSKKIDKISADALKVLSIKSEGVIESNTNLIDSPQIVDTAAN